ncbi:twin-arginine translocase TatA/TatE family subunit [Lacisediminihabitans changchengi]|uniref:Sec-independent protein translocase protein TatA n=1 Tax=Lacisediminihabitans changchengi TaxID=2787634 RepID=A0A934SJL8_9MICO|nr:twin-arginine translocase TatA/TatE family subunit [Lacisediminihabitans changchengi]MBK4347036.1 twin-arginine translocase TatA/TatE family subunit [Lacisediminihabitans changchengi]MBK4347841.1 twin-arginine translocase TatA/TatE family subunit [Lacisediminihabitans changchengi]
MLSGFTGWHALILLVIIVLIFGAAKLPALAKSVGQSMKIFKNEIKSEDKPADSTATPGVQLNETSPEVKSQTTDSSKTNS